MHRGTHLVRKGSLLSEQVCVISHAWAISSADMVGLRCRSVHISLSALMHACLLPVELRQTAMAFKQHHIQTVAPA